MTEYKQKEEAYNKIFDTLEEYRADIRKKLEDQAAQRDEDAFTNAVIDKVVSSRYTAAFSIRHNF